MNPSDYRRDYAAYRSAVERARFEHHAGLSARPDLRQDLRPVEERYADLWTREAVADLRRAFEQSHTQFETERAGLRALTGASEVGHVEGGAREATEELGRCAESVAVEWDGERVAASEVPHLLAAEGDAARRRELTRRLLDALSACDDLRAARLEALGGAARSLGFDGRRALYESFTGVGLENLSAAADAFLRGTEDAYMSHLSEWVARSLPGGAGPEYADRFFFERGAGSEAHFAARDFRALYSESLAGLGVRVASQQNLHIDDATRPGKRAESACFAVGPPADVRLVVGARQGGMDFQRRSFEEGARAQMFAWASRETSARYPEFVYTPDTATEAGHGLLLSGLFREAAWLAARRGTGGAEAQSHARRAALVDLHGARRECAALACALALDRASDVRSERLAEEYASLTGGATGFRHHAATRLLDADEWFESAANLRARLFAASLREHLRARHGRRWFDSRAAGAELVDVWNTASRYPVEELARLAWGGELSFDLLADALIAALDGRDGA
ncbi:MAG: hypothetical protein QOJ76_3610 [Acidobacteriota bacterium]|jgi:hypothetical protein|nr:hypothetical protein [Acidobacteriota bacterium]